MPGPEGLTVSVPHYDMTYQLNEIEVRMSLSPVPWSSYAQCKTPHRGHQGQDRARACHGAACAGQR